MQKLFIFLFLLAFVACKSSEETSNVSQDIIKQNQRNFQKRLVKEIQNLEKKAEKILANINKIKAENPESALENLLLPIEKLEKQLEKEKSLLKAFNKKTDQDDINALFDRLDFIERQMKKAQKSYTYAKSLDIKLEASALFASGKYDLSEKGQNLMSTVAHDIEKSIQKYHKKFPHDAIVLTVKVRGYADKAPFYANQAEDERKTQNLEISQKRADAVGGFLSNKLKNSVDEIEEDFKGMGEKLPPNVEDGAVKDAKRRICTLSLLILNK